MANEVMNARLSGKKLIDAAKAKAKKLIDAAKAKAKKLVDAAKAKAKKTVKKPTKRKTKEVKENEKRVLSALRRLSKDNLLVKPIDVRRATGLEKLDFDRTAIELCNQRLVILHQHDHPSGLLEAKRNDLIRDGRNRYYCGMTPVTQKSVESSILESANTYGPGAAIRIAQLRKDTGAPAEAFDLALKKLHETRKVAVYRDDNRATAKADGAYYVGGEIRHILYVL